jgi:hypothetical protein
MTHLLSIQNHNMGKILRDFLNCSQEGEHLYYILFTHPSQFLTKAFKQNFYACLVISNLFIQTILKHEKKKGNNLFSLFMNDCHTNIYHLCSCIGIEAMKNSEIRKVITIGRSLVVKISFSIFKARVMPYFLSLDGSKISHSLVSISKFELLVQQFLGQFAGAWSLVLIPFFTV